MPDSPEWRPVPGYEGRYEVSSEGSVRSLGFYSHNRFGTRTWRAGRVLKATISPKTGYRSVTLVDDERQHSVYRVHRVVLMAFVGPPPEGMPNGLHRDDNRLNNQLSNLRWGTHSDNTYDSVENGSHVQTRKETCGRGHDLVAPNLVESSAVHGYRGCLACKLADTGQNDDRRYFERTGQRRTRCNRGRDGFRRQLGESAASEADRRYLHIMGAHQ